MVNCGEVTPSCMEWELFWNWCLVNCVSVTPSNIWFFVFNKLLEWFKEVL